jgi:uncharacterized membrane protein YbhN (UPF0104 family)
MNARRLLRALGLLLGLAALAWIGLRFARSDALAVLQHVPAGPWRLGAALALAAVGYALALGALAFAWWRLLAGLAPTAPPAWPTMATWGVSQYGKYLPGNVAHYALRHAWSRRQATPHSVLGLAALLEAALLLLAALALALAGDAPALPLPRLDARLLSGLLLAGLLSGGLVLRWLRRRGGLAGVPLPAVPVPMLAGVFACDLAFFAAGAAILCGLGGLLGLAADWPLMLAAGAAAWAAGFVVIGAPAGLGVREAAFVALAGGALGEDRALLLIALYRLVTFLGDTLLAVAGAALMRFARSAAVAGQKTPDQTRGSA